MGRRENRRADQRRRKEEKLGRWSQDMASDFASVPGMMPFFEDGATVVPMVVSEETMAKMQETDAERAEGRVLMDCDRLRRQMHTMSDDELNRLMYMQAKDAVRNGEMEDWPEDDFGCVMWFMFSFISTEMREAFPEIAKEYIDHEEMVRRGDAFDGIPYPRSNEKNWHDAYYYRLLGVMVHAARRGCEDVSRPSLFFVADGSPRNHDRTFFGAYFH